MLIEVVLIVKLGSAGLLEGGFEVVRRLSESNTKLHHWWHDILPIDSSRPYTCGLRSAAL